LAIVLLLIGRAMRQQRLLAPPVRADDRTAAPSVAVIVPARDEAANIGRCVESLLAQDYPPGRLSITVVDDGSRDATPRIVAELAADHPSVALVRAPPLAQGWTGKCQACWLAAGAAEAPWLCFIDADMSAEPPLIADAVATAEARGVALLSLAARQELVTFAERLMIPCGLFFLAFVQDLAELQSAASSTLTVSGQFMLVRREAYFAVGGHAAVRDRVSEDLALAACLKRAGLPVLLVDGARLISTRMYDGWRSLWLGVTKNLAEMLGGDRAAIVASLAGFAICWALVAAPVLNVLALARGDAWALVGAPAALAALAAATALHVAGAAHFRTPLWYGLLFPLGYTIGAVMAFDSVRRRSTGQVRWKGRTYP